MQIGLHHLPACLLDGRAAPAEVDENPREMDAWRRFGPRHRYRPTPAHARFLNHARGAAGGQGCQRGKPGALRSPESSGGRARLLPGPPGLRMQALREVDQIRQAVLLVGVDLDFLVQAVDERGQARLLVAVAGAPRRDGRGRGGGVGIPRGRKRKLAATGGEDSENGQRGESAARLPHSGPGEGPPRRCVLSARRGDGLRSPIPPQYSVSAEQCLRHSGRRRYAPLIVSASVSRGAWLRFTVAAATCAFAAGCDPILNIQGSFFPAWIVCMTVGVVLTAAGRQLLAVSGLEPHLGPLTLIYPSLWVLTTLLTWLIFYRT